eukprot:351737-Chlamydomonas_euryale.AAC.4
MEAQYAHHAHGCAVGLCLKHTLLLRALRMARRFAGGPHIKRGCAGFLAAAGIAGAADGGADWCFLVLSQLLAQRLRNVTHPADSKCAERMAPQRSPFSRELRVSLCYRAHCHTQSKAHNMHACIHTSSIRSATVLDVPCP